MRHSLWQKRIPTLLGLLLLGVGLVTASYLANSGALFITRATPAYQPENIRLTNLSDTSFTVSYTTAEKALGTLSYSSGRDSNKVALDDRDQSTGNPRPYSTHHITVKNLEPQQNYTFTITSSDKTFFDENNKPFRVTTLKPLSQTPPNQPPIIGKITIPDSGTVTDTLIFLVSDNTQILSVQPKEDGSFILPLNSLRESTLESYLILEDDSLIKMLITNGKLNSNIRLRASQINPVPIMTLSHNYDFTINTQPLSQTTSASESGENVSFPSFSANQPTTLFRQPEILSPEKEEAGFTDQKPSFNGTAIPGENVEILIQSENEITATIQAGDDGSWSYRPDTELEPGEHTITVKTRNSEGILQILTRSFTVYAAGSQFIEPSVSPEPEPTPTATPVPTTPPTPTPTPIIIEVTVTPPPPEEEPGSSSVLIFGILASLIVGGGSLMFLTNRNRI